MRRVERRASTALGKAKEAGSEAGPTLRQIELRLLRRPASFDFAQDEMPISIHPTDCDARSGLAMTRVPCLDFARQSGICYSLDVRRCRRWVRRSFSDLEYGQVRSALFAWVTARG